MTKGKGTYVVRIMIMGHKCPYILGKGTVFTNNDLSYGSPNNLYTPVAMFSERYVAHINFFSGRYTSENLILSQFFEE